MTISSSHALNADTEYARLELRIRALTTAIWYSYLQHDTSTTTDGTLTSRAYERIATLLTRNSNDGSTIAVTGGPIISSSISITAVVTEPIPVYGLGSEMREAGSLGPECHEKREFSPTETTPWPIRIERIQPSGADLASLADGTRTATDISSHASDILQALLTVSKARDLDSYNLMRHFIFRRCFPQIHARIKAASLLLKYSESESLVTILKSWTLQPEDKLNSQDFWEKVTSVTLQRVFKEAGIPQEPESNGEKFQLNAETVSAWAQILFSALDQLIGAVEEYDRNVDRKSLDSMVEALMILHPFLDTKHCPAIEIIFSQKSLRELLESHKKFPSNPSHEERNHAWGAVHPYSLDITDDERGEFEDATEHVLRYLRSLLPWHIAVLHLSNMIPRSFGDKPPIFHILHVPIPVSGPVSSPINATALPVPPTLPSAPSPLFPVPASLSSTLVPSSPILTPSSIGDSLHSWNRLKMISIQLLIKNEILPKLLARSQYSDYESEHSILIAAIDDLLATFPTHRTGVSNPDSCRDRPGEASKKTDESNEEFTGSVHCAAVLMGLIYQASTGSSPLAWVLQDSDRIVGLQSPRKCCSTCSSLARALFNQEIADIKAIPCVGGGRGQRGSLRSTLRYNDSYRSAREQVSQFKLPGTTGIIQPWSPPPEEVGVPVRVLKKLEDDLVYELMEVLDKYLEPKFSKIVEAARAAAAESGGVPLPESPT